MLQKLALLRKLIHRPKSIPSDGTPAISVIVPVFGSEARLPACLKSIQSQSQPDFEVIIVDDGSSGDVAQIASLAVGNDQRFSCLRHSHNQGTFVARLTGVKSARGRYLSFIDSDDFVDKDFFKTLLNAADSSDADIVETAFFLHDDSTEASVYRRGAAEVLKDEVILKSLLKGNIFNALWNKLIKRTTWIDAMHRFEHLPLRLCFAEDLLCTFHLILAANRYRRLDTALYHYHLHADPQDELRLDARLRDLDTAFHLMTHAGQIGSIDEGLETTFLTREFVVPARTLLTLKQNLDNPPWTPDSAFETWPTLKNIWATANT